MYDAVYYERSNDYPGIDAFISISKACFDKSVPDDAFYVRISSTCTLVFCDRCLQYIICNKVDYDFGLIIPLASGGFLND